MNASSQHTTASDLNDRWDVIIIGAGPAGALTANLLGRSDLRVLLVDAKPLPRAKVCGGCLNARSIELLEHHELSAVLDQSFATPLKTIQLVGTAGHFDWPLPQNLVINRADFDAALVNAAIEAGVTFQPRTLATVLPEADPGSRTVRLQYGGDISEVFGRVVICADGLGQSSLRQLSEFSTKVMPSSRIGLGVVVRDDSEHYPSGRLSMVVSPTGYVGLARTADGRLNIAAAVDAETLASSSPSAVTADILAHCGMPRLAGIESVQWQGTPTLTRSSRRVAANRLLVLGDSAGYVEPFTGEGMSWAMHSAILLAPIARRGIDRWSDALESEWNLTLKTKVVRNQWTCRLISKILRSPRWTGLTLQAVHKVPFLRRRVMSRLAGR
ncbi:NAD(P)/FAD-dependent oxidoreductase [Thalassoroseus pseudoceratinae]|uniref:NAD(P)/FAD-dependent oxidoreductase n=1 Tax=Thalassoroseus pseudoceratinae TaxID=2713176 RepID=UPI0014201F18|nr:NAD(P)/FAD-dependent oxidoreductase [Thalassoroseus pseudoceratinae]